MKKIVLASNNAGKLIEFKTLLSDCGFDIHAQASFGVSSVEETGLSFVENALIKARHAAKATGMPAIADDSGIEIDELQGAPGIYSARFAGLNATDADNNNKLLAELSGIDEKKRTARYQCVLVFMRHANDPTPIIAQGSWEGRILNEGIGTGGFGYDPLFFIDSHNCTSAELPKEEKNRISHRAIAMKVLLSQLSKVEHDI